MGFDDLRQGCVLRGMPNHFDSLRDAQQNPLGSPGFYRTRNGNYFSVFEQCNGFAHARSLAEPENVPLPPNE